MGSLVIHSFQESRYVDRDSGALLESGCLWQALRWRDAAGGRVVSLVFLVARMVS